MYSFGGTLSTDVREWVAYPPRQIGAVAFMEAGNAAANGSSAAKSTVASMVAHGRRDSGFVR